ncbi:MAG: extracellular solute-binding protein [Anaerolineae bacterium]|nr:extracellular solute-binding protein [Anaerolineae bacterium]
MKRVLLLALLVVLALSVAIPAFAQDESLEIYITDMNEATMTWYNEVAIPAFQETHPGVTVEMLTGGWGDFDASVAGWITTGEGPDIVYLGSEYAATFCNLLTDVSPFLTEEDTAPFLPAALETVTCDGAPRGLPLLMSARPIYYRADLAAEGADFVPPTTFEEALAFVAANSAVENGALTKMGFMDIGSSLFDSQEFIAYIWSAGGELYNEDGTSAFDSDATAQALQYMYDRRRTILPTEDTAGLPPIEGAAIASGSVISGIWAMWQLPPVSDPIWDNITIAPYPAGPDGEQVVQVFVDWLSVPSYVENPELAMDFLKFITSQENAVTLSQVAGYTPVRPDAWETLQADPVWSRILDVAAEYGRGFSDIRASAELRPLIVEQATLFLTDQQSLEQTQQNLKEEYDLILEENGYLD